MMEKLRFWIAQMRYPTPEMGDFVEDMTLDKYIHDDHDDNNAVRKTKKGKN